MRRIIAVVLFVAISMAGIAQNRNKKEKMKVDFYGVDFSVVNVVGAREVEADFIKAFHGINDLLVSESSKYDVGKFMRLEVLSIVTDRARQQTETLTGQNFKDREIKTLSLQEIIKKYPQTTGKCLLIIAKELNKAKNKGTFIAVIFDGAHHQILFEQTFSGKAKGFGLRNFWAGSLHDGFRNFGELSYM